jgi:type I restriction enzyme M protein
MPPSSPISQDEINSILWKACDTFRGTVDPSEYKNYILVMLFLKYVSDVWLDHYEGYKKQYGDDEARILRRMARERFVLPKGTDYYSLYEQRNEINIGERIDVALAAIEEANIGKLQGVFRNISFNSEAALGQTKQRNTRLKNLLTDFHDPRLDMRPSRINGLDVIGNAYEYLIGRFAATAGKKAGEFYTSPEVSRLLAKLLAPKPGERIYDPACGSGSLLIKCTEEVGSNPQSSGTRDYAVYGQENNGSTWALAMMNMFLHDVNQPDIKWGDTIDNPMHIEGDQLKRFNVVTANPPFSLDKWGAENAANDQYKRFWRGIPPKTYGDYAFITHMIESTYLEPGQNGRVGVVVPHGVLFRGGSEGKIRQQFIEENLLDAVIGLPANLFFGTGIPATILIFKRNRLNKKVLFIDASREYQPGTTQNYLRKQDIEKILKTYNKRATVDKYSYLADLDELKENDFNLNIPRYVDTFEPEPLVDIISVNSEIDALKTDLLDIEAKMTNYLQELGLDG